MKSMKSVHLIATILTLGAIALTAAGQRDQDVEPQSSNPSLTDVRAELSPIGWLDDTLGLVVKRGARETLGKGEDSCKGVGLYSLKGSTLSLWKDGAALCDALLRAGESASLSKDGRFLLYSDPSQFGAVRRLELAGNVAVTLVSKCLPASSAPSFSSDGHKIAVLANCEAPEAESYLHLLNADGSGFRPIGPHQARTRESRPTWSPNERHLALVSQDSSGPSDIVVVNTASGIRRRIATGYAPSWSPDGNWIAFLSRIAVGDSGPAIFLIHPNGSGKVVIVPARTGASTMSDEGNNAAPLVWSPDATQLAFPRKYSLWMVDLRETKRRVRRLVPAI